MKGEPQVWFDSEDNIRFDRKPSTEAGTRRSPLLSVAGSPHPEWDADTLGSDPGECFAAYEPGLDAYAAVHPPMEPLAWMNPGMPILNAAVSPALSAAYSDRAALYGYAAGNTASCMPGWVSMSSDTNGEQVEPDNPSADDEEESDDHGPYTAATPEPWYDPSLQQWPTLPFDHHPYLVHPSMEIAPHCDAYWPVVSYQTGFQPGLSDETPSYYGFQPWPQPMGFPPVGELATSDHPSIKQAAEMPAVLLQALSQEGDLTLGIEDSDEYGPPSDTGCPAESEKSAWISTPMATKPVPSPEPTPEPSPRSATVFADSLIDRDYEADWSDPDTEDEDIQPSQVMIEVESLTDMPPEEDVEELPGLVPELSVDSPLQQGHHGAQLAARVTHAGLDLSALGIRVIGGPGLASMGHGNDLPSYLRRIWMKTPEADLPPHSPMINEDESIDCDLESMVRAH